METPDRFTVRDFMMRLSRLTNSASSIQQLSKWLIKHRQYFHEIVKIWRAELLATTNGMKQVILIYLANDVIQNSRKRGREYLKEFGKVMTGVLIHVGRSDTVTVQKVRRVLNIWLDRHVYSETEVAGFQQVLIIAEQKEHERQKLLKPQRFTVPFLTEVKPPKADDTLPRSVPRNR